VKKSSSKQLTERKKVAEIFYDKDADLSIIQGKKVAVLGFGSQGHAHALNLKDSGVDVVVGLQPGSKSTAKAEEQGLKVLSPSEAVKWADVTVVLVPDPKQRDLYTSEIAPNLKPGDSLVFGHGFSIRFGFIQPPANVDVFLVAPKGPGHIVRREFAAGRGVPNLIAVEQDYSGNAFSVGLSYSKAIGGTRAGTIKTTFTEETETDLFGEQAVLCGGASHTAEYGDYVSGPRVIDPRVKENMKAVLADVQSGAFAKRFIADQDAGAPEFKALRAKGEAHPIEATGRELRKLFSWIKNDDDYKEGSAAR